MNRDSNVFGPDDLMRLQRALDRSFKALAFAFPENPPTFEARRIREMLANHIVALAGRGERDPVTLSNSALAALPPYSSVNSLPAKLQPRSVASGSRRRG
jgi:hypothetical protein